MYLPLVLLMRHEGEGWWEVVVASPQRPLSPSFSHVLYAHRARQLSPHEDAVFQTLGEEQGRLYHVFDVRRN